MKPRLHIVAIAILSFGLGCSMVWFLGEEGRELLPQNVTIKESSPDSTISALILSGHTGDAGDLLGTKNRFYLAFQHDSTIYIVDRDLSEGKGTYEGGIIGLQWLNTHEVKVERFISDRRNDIVFNRLTHQWTNLGVSR